VRRAAEPTRVLATVLFTDIVDSTKHIGRLGDRRWRELLNTHDDVARQLVEEFNGRLVHTTGDGILATFDGPGRGNREVRRQPGGPRDAAVEGRRGDLGAVRGG
jgi:class 3 adenylate cyclase